MKYATWVRILAMGLWAFAVSTAIAADGAAASGTPAAQPPDTPADSGTLEVVLSVDAAGQPVFRYRMGDVLRVRATGTIKESIDKALAQGQPVTLVMTGARMTQLPFSSWLSQDGAARYLDFRLVRDAGNENSRHQWQAFFETQRGYDMYPALAIDVAGLGPYLLNTDWGDGKVLQFNVTTFAWVSVLLAGGLLILVLTLWGLGLARFSTMRECIGGPFSLGKTQMAFWFVIVILTVVGAFVITGSLEAIPAQTIGLLGISSATGLGSVLMRKGKEAAAQGEARTQLAKVDERLKAVVAELGPLEREVHSGQAPDSVKARATQLEQEQKDLNAQRENHRKQSVATLPPKPPRRHFLQDLCMDADGSCSIHRLQAIAWTLFLGAVFVLSVLRNLSIPEFPETMLTLMGISNMTYLGFKFPEKTEADK